MQKLSIIFDISSNKLTFQPSHYQHSRVIQLNKKLIPADKKLAPTQKFKKLQAPATQPTKGMMPKYIVPVKQTEAKAKHVKPSKIILNVLALPAPSSKVQSFVKSLELAMISAITFNILLNRNIQIYLQCQCEISIPAE